ncbi:MAG: radical SAM protein [DPANN group archaeon]|nr:radical SAM protein [DPANN group archaeon]
MNRKVRLIIAELGPMENSITSVDIKFGYSCNNNCVHCVIAGHVDRLKKENKPIDRTTDEIKEHILDAKSKGAMSVVFTGGEVTIRPDFLELLEFSESNGVHPGLQTNGRSFCVRQFAQKTLNMVPNLHFEVALHSSKKEIHDKITRVDGSFDQTVTGIKNLILLGAKSVNFKVVISRSNFKDLKDIIALAKDLNINQVDIAYPHGMGNARKYWFDIVPKYTEIHPFVLEAATFAKENNVEISFEAIPLCFLAGFEKHASELEFIIQYMNGKSSELRQVGELEINWQTERLRIKTKLSQCKKCSYFNVCEGVWCEYVEFYGGNEFAPVKGKTLTLKDIL